MFILFLQSSKGPNPPFTFADKELQQLGNAAAAAAFAGTTTHDKIVKWITLKSQICLVPSAGPGKYLDPSFSVGYLMSPYSAAYANGFNGSHVVRNYT